MDTALRPAWPHAAVVPTIPVVEEVLPDHLLADLGDPSLVLSDGYIGPDRREGGWWARFRRATFPPRRSVLRLEAMVVALVAVVTLASWTFDRFGVARRTRRRPRPIRVRPGTRRPPREPRRRPQRPPRPLLLVPRPLPPRLRPSRSPPR